MAEDSNGMEFEEISLEEARRMGRGARMEPLRLCRKFLRVDDVRWVDPVGGVIRRPAYRIVRPPCGPRVPPRPPAVVS
jgi:hypothetical protein